MKRLLLALPWMILSFGLFSWSAPHTQAQVVAEPPEEQWDMFYEPLLPYGDWVYTQQYGWAWRPRAAEPGWRPYTVGHWEYTDDGWAWDSDEPWGWACYHYGRWFFDADYGWCWRPGRVWAPAWVLWRTSDDWVGWCPLPPGVRFAPGVGFATTGYDWDSLCPPWWFSFVPIGHFDDHDLDRFIDLEPRNVTHFHHTHADLGIQYREGHVYTELPVHDRLERSLGHPIERRHIASVGNWNEWRSGPRQQGNDLRFFRPDTTRRGEKAFTYPEGQGQTAQRHEEERQTQQRRYEQMQQQLGERQRQDLAHPPQGTTPEELRQQHAAEQRALQEQQQRENRAAETWRGRENWMQTAPRGTPAPRGGAQEHGTPSPAPRGGVQERGAVPPPRGSMEDRGTAAPAPRGGVEERGEERRQ